MTKKAAPAAAETPVAPATPKVETAKFITVTGARFIHPFTQTVFDGRPTEATLDSWIQSQIDAGKMRVA